MIPLCKPAVGEKEIKAVQEVIASGMLVQGKKVELFEQGFAEFCETKYCAAVNSGTAALHSALHALEIKEGDEVITSPFTFVATANSILMQGAKPVFADIDADTFNISPALIEKAITKKTKAIMPVHLFGQMAGMKPIHEIAKKHKLKIIEDACQAHGAQRDNVPVGGLSDAACFSFYAIKNLGVGEGGAVVSNNEKTIEYVKRFRHHGQSQKTRYEYFDLGYNYRMTDLTAAIALEQLKKLPELTKKRIKNAETLSQGLAGIKGLKLPFVEKNSVHVFHQFTLKVLPEFSMTRDDLKDYLKEKGIDSAVFYPKPIYQSPFYLQQGFRSGLCPVAEKVSKQVLSIPVHPMISDEELNYIIQCFEEIK